MRPWQVVRKGMPSLLSNGRCNQSMCAWIKSKSPAVLATSSISAAWTAVGSVRGRPRRSALGQTALSFALVTEIAASKERYFMAELDHFVDQPCNHPLGASVELRWDTLRQRGYLSDFHPFSGKSRLPKISNSTFFSSDVVRINGRGPLGPTRILIVAVSATGLTNKSYCK